MKLVVHNRLHHETRHKAKVAPALSALSAVAALVGHCPATKQLQRGISLRPPDANILMPLILLIDGRLLAPSLLRRRFGVCHFSQG
jgi:hypothetical protein